MSTPKKQQRKRLGKGLSAILDTQQKITQREIESKQNTNTIVNNHDLTQSIALLSDDSPNQTIPKGGPRSPETRLAGINQIRLDQIRPGGHQPRTRFDEDALESLAASIRSVGVIQPIMVRPAGDGTFEIIAGERRWRASKLAGLQEIPVILSDADEQMAAETALIENLQREDLNPIERGEAIRRLIERFGLTQTQVAERVGLDRSSVSNLLRLGDLEEPIRDLLASGELSLGHGKALLSIPAGPARLRLAQQARKEGWSVRRLETESKASNNNSGAAAISVGEHGSGDVETRALERRLSEHLGTKVSLRVNRSGKGTVQIRFFDLDHFDDLMSRIGFDAGGSD